MMGPLKENIIIIGNGIAAITAIKAIRKHDQTSDIHLLGEEPFYPYNRIRLSKGLLATLDEDKILLQKKAWYEEQNIHIHRHTKALSVNPSKKTVLLDNHQELPYTKLLLANGAKNRVPPIKGIDKEHVYSLRTLEDARNIQRSIQEEGTVLNIGGGIQGLETAWILSQDGKKVIIAELASRLMSKQLDEHASTILLNAIRKQGIEVHLNTPIEEIVGEGSIVGAKTKTGDVIDCNSVIFAIGIKTNIDLLKDSGVDTHYGVLVNDRMETSIEGIYAAGDIVELDGHIYGLWNIAIEQGKVAGSNIACVDATYKHIVPVTTLNAFDLSLFSMGVIEDSEATDILVEEDLEHASYKKVLLKHHKIIGAIMIGNIRSSPLLKRAIEGEMDFQDYDYNHASIDALLEYIKKSK